MRTSLISPWKLFAGLASHRFQAPRRKPSRSSGNRGSSDPRRPAGRRGRTGLRPRGHRRPAPGGATSSRQRIRALRCVQFCSPVLMATLGVPSANRLKWTTPGLCRRRTPAGSRCGRAIRPWPTGRSTWPRAFPVRRRNVALAVETPGAASVRTLAALRRSRGPDGPGPMHRPPRPAPLVQRPPGQQLAGAARSWGNSTSGGATPQAELNVGTGRKSGCPWYRRFRRPKYEP